MNNNIVVNVTEIEKRMSADGLSSHLGQSIEDCIFLRINIPDCEIQKCLQFSKSQVIGDVKYQCLSSLPKELPFSFNYGFYYKPTDLKAGIYLKEDKPLTYYPFERVACVELRYKRKIPNGAKADEKCVRTSNTRSYRKKFLERVDRGCIDKVLKMCSKGLDPNFFIEKKGNSVADTPLTMVCRQANCTKKISALIQGGALADFRSSDGLTPLHHAVIANNMEAVIALLQVGAPLDAKDTKGLTPLYLSVAADSDVLICQRLLNERAVLGTTDSQGCQEIHRACRLGLDQHLEQLLFYGADTNAANVSGNTPLHVCAVNNRENCAKILLFRGASNQVLNAANQTPAQSATIAGNVELAGIIRNYGRANLRGSIACRGAVHYFTNKPVYASTHLPSSTPNEASLKEAQSPVYNNATSQDALSLDSDKTAQEDDSASESSGVGTSATNSDVAETSDSTKRRQAVISSTVNLDGIGDVCKWDVDSAPMRRRSLTIDNRCARAKVSPVEKGNGEIKTCTVYRTHRGYGFALRGANTTAPTDQQLSNAPALQYLDDVDPNGPAAFAGLNRGDYLLKINGKDVCKASHRECVAMIRNATFVNITVLTQKGKSVASVVNNVESCNPPHYATLPNKKRASSFGRAPPVPPRRDPKTTLSVGKAQSRNILRMNGCSDDQKTASVRCRPLSTRITATQLHDIFNRHSEQMLTSSSTAPQSSPKVYASVAQMKRVKANGCETMAAPCELGRQFHSVPDLARTNMDAQRPISPISKLSHAPPPKPLSTSGQIVKVEADEEWLNGASVCGNIVHSSFKPSHGAIIYESPAALNFDRLQYASTMKTPKTQICKYKSSKMARIKDSFTQPIIPEPDYSDGEEGSLMEKGAEAVKFYTLPRNYSHCIADTPTPDSSCALQLQWKSGANEDADNSSSGVSSDQDIRKIASGDKSRLNLDSDSPSFHYIVGQQILLAPPPQFSDARDYISHR